MSPVAASSASASYGKRWTVTYTKHLKQKRKVYHDGFLEFSASAHKVILYDEGENPIDSKFLQKDETVECGTTLTLEAHLVDVGELQGDQKPLIFSKTIHRGVRLKESSGILQQNVCRKVESAGSRVTKSLPISADSALKEWTVLYTTQLTQKAKKYHDGILRLVQVGQHAKQIILLDDEGGLLGNRFLKSAECVESGMKCQLPSYLIEICELRSQKDDIVKRSSEETLSFTGSKSGKTSSKTSQMCNPPKFTSPLNSDGLHKGPSECNTSFNRPQIGKSTITNMNDAPRTAHQILSVMKKPLPEVKYGNGIPAELVQSSASSVPEIIHEEIQGERIVNPSGTDHFNKAGSSSSKCESSEFPTQFNTSSGSCSKVKAPELKSLMSTHEDKYSQNYNTIFDHQFIRRPAVGLAVGQIPASAMLDAQNQQSGFAAAMVATNTSLLEGKSGTANQLCTINKAGDGRSDKAHPLAAKNVVSRNPKIQKLVADCPSFDLGF